MRPDLLQPLQILTQLAVNAVGEDLAILAINDIPLSIEKPRWDLVLSRVLDDGDDTFEFFGGELSSPNQKRPRQLLQITLPSE